MATHKYTTSPDGDNPTQDIEQLKAEIRTAFHEYEYAWLKAQEYLSFALAHPDNKVYATRWLIWKRKRGRAGRAILALTAPAEPAPEPDDLARHALWHENNPQPLFDLWDEADAPDDTAPAGGVE